jgi:Family of unknown function (DUF5752)
MSRQQEGEFSEAARILRTVPDKHAFYFYRHKHAYSYIGTNARSLTEFLEQVKTVNIASLQFHNKRGDFRNWVQTTIGDATLSKQISSLRTTEGEELRNSLVKAVGARLEELQKFH